MKICSAAQAAQLVSDGATVLVDGSGGGVNEPTAVLAGLEKRFLEKGHPCGLSLVHVSGMGDGHGGGIDRFAHPEMVQRVVGGHWGWSPRMQQLALENKIEAYCLPQGTLSHLLREIAAGRPGVVSSVGIDTFVDPRRGGGKLNDRATDNLVQVVTLSDREWLFTPSFPIDVAIIRGTRADSDGNITMDGEGLIAETLAAAQAAKNSGGIVIAQVREIVERGSLDPRRVRVPGILVDVLVVDAEQRLSFATRDDPFLAGDCRAPSTDIGPMALSVRKVIARRAAMELRQGDVINLGFGMPDGVAAVLAEELTLDQVTLTLEQGHIGGTPVGGSDFGLCINPQASLDAGQQFDWYDGGGLDLAVLSFAQIDAMGNVNVGRFGNRMPGVGGFINISQGARRLIFVGTFVNGPLNYQLDGSTPMVLPEGGAAKFIPVVEQVSFAASRALANEQEVLYVTERAVFRLVSDGIELVEIAPGVDLHRDVLANMSFLPKLSRRVALMNERIFGQFKMGLELTKSKALE